MQTNIEGNNNGICRGFGVMGCKPLVCTETAPRGKASCATQGGFLGREHVERVFVATFGLPCTNTYIYIYNYSLLKKKTQASLLPIGWCTCDTVPNSTTEPAVITLPWMACTFFILQVHLLRRWVFRCLDCSHWFSHVKYHFFQHLLHSFPSIHHILLNSAWHPSSSHGLTEILLR